MASRCRAFHSAAYPSAPTSGTRSVQHSGTLPSSPWLTASTASFAITRYVVYLPPATTTRPGAGCATVCSRDSFEVDSDSPDSSGRSPAYTPSTSSRVSGVTSTRFTWSSR